MAITTSGTPRGMLWTGHAMRGLLCVFLLWEGVAKITVPAKVVEDLAALGYPASEVRPLGIVVVACALLYAWNATATLGAILLTGYFGGAVATHVRLQQDFWTHTSIPILFGVAIWLALWLETVELRRLTPLRR